MLIYNQKYCYASLLKCCMKILFVLTQVETSSCMWVNKHKAKCILIIVRPLFCSFFVHYFNWKFETLFFCWGWIVLNLFWNLEQKWASCSYKKKCIWTKTGWLVRFCFGLGFWSWFEYVLSSGVGFEVSFGFDLVRFGWIWTGLVGRLVRS